MNAFIHMYSILVTKYNAKWYRLYSIWAVILKLSYCQDNFTCQSWNETRLCFINYLQKIVFYRKTYDHLKNWRLFKCDHFQRLLLKILFILIGQGSDGRWCLLQFCSIHIHLILSTSYDDGDERHSNCQILMRVETNKNFRFFYSSNHSQMRKISSADLMQMTGWIYRRICKSADKRKKEKQKKEKGVKLSDKQAIRKLTATDRFWHEIAKSQE